MTSPSSSARRHGVDPGDLAETGEVTVGADDGQTVLDADGRHDSVSDQPRTNVMLAKAGSPRWSGDRVRAPVSRSPARLATRPRAPTPQWGSRAGPRSGVGGDAEKCPQRDPGDSYALGTVEGRHHPVSRGDVKWTVLINRVEQDVGIDEHYRASGPSSRSSASATLETSMRMPSRRVRATKGCCCGWARMPRRISSLTASLTPRPSFRRRAWTAWVVSGSNSIVVRMLEP